MHQPVSIQRRELGWHVPSKLFEKQLTGDVTMNEWLEEVDQVIGNLIGLTHDDLADQCWRDWYESGMTPLEAASMALEAEGFPVGELDG